MRKIWVIIGLVVFSTSVATTSCYQSDVKVIEAISVGDSNFVMQFIRNNGIDMYLSNGETILLQAIRSNRSDIALQVIKNGADCNLLSKADSESAISLAIQMKQDEVVRALIDNGVDVNIANKDGTTPIMISSYTDNEMAVELLIAADANMNMRDKEGWTALHFACGYGYCDIAKMLIDAGASTRSLTNSGNTPREVALQNDKIDVIDMLNKIEVDVSDSLFVQ